MQSNGRTLVVVVLIVLALLLTVVVSALMMLSGESAGTGATIIELDLTVGLAEFVPEDPFSRAFLDGRPGLREVLGALRRAAENDRVVALVARVGSTPLGLATIQELRGGLEAFRASGKRTVAFAETFGEWTPGNGGYYLASAFDEIYLQPSGDVGLAGLRYEVPFLAGTLDKLGLEPQLDRRHEYKNAINQYTETEMTAAHEEAMQALADSQFAQMVAGIAAGRELPEAEVRDLFDRGPFLAQEALEAGLVDGLAYRDEVWDRLRDSEGADSTFVDLLRLARPRLPGFMRGPKVAVIHGVGAVVRGESRYDPWSGLLMGSETVGEGFRQAVDDPEVEAILFRVDSPGGSYVASDTVWRETVRAREAGKPVVVSMGELAASGGYFVSMSADRIVAHPGTITGSIGVYGGKMVSRELWRKLGVTFDSVSTSVNAGMWSSVEPFGDYGWERLQDSLDRIYEDFVGKVAAGRGLEVAEVEKIARGRIWSGEQAFELGLVDALGGYPRAVAEIRELIGLEADAPVRLETFPRPRSTLEVLLERLARPVGAGTPGQIAQSLVAQMERLQHLLARLGLGESARGPLYVAPPDGAR